MKKKEYDFYPYLKEGVESENYKIQYISDPYTAFITYDSNYNYFFIAQAPFRKIDRYGIEKIKIEHAQYLDNPLFTHYLFDKEGVYDFSKDTVKKEKFNEIVNADYSLKSKEWEKQFSEYYHKAQIVVYGDDMDYDYYPIYLKINNKWILFHTRSYDRLNKEFDIGISFEGYPAKFNKLILLKAVQQRTFSNGLTEGDLSERNMPKEEFSLTYPKKLKIKTLFYKKEMVSEHIVYTPIPIEYSGTAYYRLKIENDILNFKEKALKYGFYFSIKSHLYWFVLPEKYIQNTDISFIQLRYPHNLNESGSNGLYIILKK